MNCYNGTGNCKHVNKTHTITNCEVWGAWSDPADLNCEKTKKRLDELSYIADPANHVYAPFTNVSFTVEPLPYDVSDPWDFVFLPDDSILLTERNGSVKHLENGETTTVATIPAVGYNVDGFWNAGLLGIAKHPNFSENQYIYLYYTYDYNESLYEERHSDTPTWHRVVRYQFHNNTLEKDTVILDNIPGSGKHGSGRIQFGPDNKLYILTGDGDQPRKTRDPDTLHGKVLRINPDGTIPADNPFDTAVYSRGHRNHQGMAWDKAGRMYQTEHGDWRHDEINQIQPGKDYGYDAWKCRERHVGNPRSRNNTPPIFCSQEWTMAPSGATYIKKKGHPWQNSLFVGLLRGKHLHRFIIRNGSLQRDEIFYVNTNMTGLSQRIRNVVFKNKSLYIIGDYTGIARITPAS